MITTFLASERKWEHNADKSKNDDFLVRSARRFCKMDILKNVQNRFPHNKPEKNKKSFIQINLRKAMYI